MKIVTIYKDNTTPSYNYNTGHIEIGGFFFKTAHNGNVTTSQDLYTSFRLCKKNLPVGYKFVNIETFEKEIKS